MPRRPEVCHTRVRQSALTAMGVFCVARGLAVLGEPTIADISEAILHELLLPIPLRIALWVTCGLVGIVASLGPIRWRPAGFVAVALMPIERAVSYGWSALMWLVPGVPQGDPVSFAFAAFWGALVYVGAVVASMPEIVVRPRGEVV